MLDGIYNPMAYVVPLPKMDTQFTHAVVIDRLGRDEVEHMVIAEVMGENNAHNLARVLNEWKGLQCATIN